MKNRALYVDNIGRDIFTLTGNPETNQYTFYVRSFRNIFSQLSVMLYLITLAIEAAEVLSPLLAPVSPCPHGIQPRRGEHAFLVHGASGIDRGNVVGGDGPLQRRELSELKL